MAARNATIELTPGDWVLISDGAVSALTDETTVFVTGLNDALIAVTGNATPPISDSEGRLFEKGEGWANLSLQNYFRGASSPDHIWAKSRFATAIFVSHK